MSIESSIFFILVFLLACCSVYFYRKFGHLMNSPFLFCAGTLVTLVGNYIIGGNNNDYNVPVISYKYYQSIGLYYGIGVAGFLLPWFLVDIKDSAQADREIAIKLPHFFDQGLLFLFWLLLFYGIYTLQQLPFFELLTGRIDINQADEASRKLFIGYLALMYSLSVLICIRVSYVFNFCKSKGWSAYVLLASSFIGCFWAGKRQMFLFFLVAFLYMRFFSPIKKPIKLRMYFYGAICLVLVFMLGDKLKYNHPVNHSNTIILGYFGWPLLNVNSVLNLCQFEGCKFQSLATATEILPARIGGKELLSEFQYLLHEPTSPSGYFLYWFLDFGFFGVALGGLLLGLVTVLSNRFKKNSHFHYYWDVLVVYCCGTSVIYSHLISLTNFILPSFILFFLYWFFSLDLSVFFKRTEEKLQTGKYLINDV